MFRSTGANAFAKNQKRLAYEDKRDLYCIYLYIVLLLQVSDEDAIQCMYKVIDYAKANSFIDRVCIKMLLNLLSMICKYTGVEQLNKYNENVELDNISFYSNTHDLYDDSGSNVTVSNELVTLDANPGGNLITDISEHRAGNTANECGEVMLGQTSVNQVYNSDEVNRCNKCNNTFSKPSMLKRHMRIHKITRSLKCTNCGLEFNRMHRLKEHMVSAHNMGASCDPEKSLTDLPNPNRQQEYHQSDSQLHETQGSNCTTPLGKEFKQESEETFSDKVMVVHNPSSNVRSDTCTFNFEAHDTQSTKQRGHVTESVASMSVVHANTNVIDTTSECINDVKYISSDVTARATFTSTLVDDNEAKTQTVKDRFQCSVCDKSFKRSSALERHKKFHSDDNPYVCHVCNLRYPTLAILLSHVKKKHPDDVDDVKYAVPEGDIRPSRLKFYECPVCGKIIKTEGHMRRHSLLHTGDTPFKCSLCGMGFKRRYVMLEHERSHSGEASPHQVIRSHQCATCGKCFPRPIDLRRHIILHTGVKPYQCSICGKGFTRTYYFKIHKRRHHSDNV